MSATAVRKSNKSAMSPNPRSNPLDRWKQQVASDSPDGSATITIDPADPMQSLQGITVHRATPSNPKRSAPRPFSDERPIATDVPSDSVRDVEAQLERISGLMEQLTPAIVPIPTAAPAIDNRFIPKPAKPSRHDAWWAAILVTMFVAVAVTWHNGQMAQAKDVIASLTKQLEAVKLTLTSRVEEAKALYQKVSDAEHDNAKLKRDLANSNPSN
jgi:hypothetical protein